MNRNDLIARIRESLLDPWNDIDDYADLDPVDEIYAKSILWDIRENEKASELEPDECVPAEATANDVQEVMNCLIRWSKHRRQIRRLAEWITETENVCLFDQFRSNFSTNCPEVIPVDFLYNTKSFPFSLKLANATADVATLLSIGKKSATTFNANHEYCWFDKEKWQLFSTNTPFADGILDAEALAKYAVESGDKDILNEIASQMDAELWDEIFPYQ